MLPGSRVQAQFHLAVAVAISKWLRVGNMIRTVDRQGCTSSSFTTTLDKLHHFLNAILI